MITHGRILQANAAKGKGEQLKGTSVNVGVESVAPEGNEIRIAYKYEIEYHDDVAKMEIKGEMFTPADSELGKKILEGWKKNKQLPAEAVEEVLTAVTYAGSSIGTLLAFTINVSAPINVPHAKIAPANAQAPKAG